jgi:hypothetical protein
MYWKLTLTTSKKNGQTNTNDLSTVLHLVVLVSEHTALVAKSKAPCAASVNKMSFTEQA